MITKERLKELIEQGATVYSTSWEEEVDLSQKCEFTTIYMNGKINDVLVVFEDDEHHPSYWLEYLEEDVEKGKWITEFGNITRIERLELPTWKEFLSKHKYTNPIRFYQKNKYISMGRVFPMKSRKIYVSWSYEGCNPSFEWVKPLTKENYTLACRKCKELFLGDKTC